VPTDPGVEGTGPEVGSAPLQAPEPVQEVTSFVVMVRVVELPSVIAEGEAARETAGVFGEVGGVAAVTVIGMFAGEPKGILLSSICHASLYVPGAEGAVRLFNINVAVSPCATAVGIAGVLS